MMCRGFLRIACFLLVLGPMLLAGCGSGGGKTVTVTGTVTYEGQPVERGAISFLPADQAAAEKSGTAGGEIVNGKYSVAGVAPGKKRVEIVSRPAGGTERRSNMTMDEYMKLQKEEMTKGLRRGKKTEKAEAIPANAIGNNAQVEVSASTTSFDFKLLSPGKK